MDRIDRFAKEMEKVDYYISNPLDFLYEHIDSPTSAEIIECYRFICCNNRDFVKKHREYLESLEECISGVRPLKKVSKDLEEPTEVIRSERHIEDEDISEAIDYVTYCNFVTELDVFLDTLTREDIIRLKLHFLREVNLHEAIIREEILKNPLANLSRLQGEYCFYKEVLERLKLYTKRHEEEASKTEVIDSSNIILLPTNKSSYLLGDISNYPERSREIKIAFDKIIEGYFLQTKDLKAIEGKKDSLYEYRNPNGLRILYVVKNNYIFITSLFFKDKQKSTRINGYYDDALNRYYSVSDYLMNNINNPDFYIEQAELVGQIYSFLETNMVVNKRLGDKNE